jgi:pimeloyl-ACP methyl ester carboxylesterase
MGTLKYKFSEGQGRGPIIVLIHGLGMTEGVWTEPYKGRLLGGLLPFRYVLTDLHNNPPLRNLGFYDSEPKRKIRGLTLSTPLEYLPDPPESFWQYLQGKGYDLITWTQKRPSGPMEEGVKELNHILGLVKKRFPKRRFVLIGHSRGGLIARRYLDKFYKYKGEIAAIITLSAPHHGSRLALFGRALSPIIKALALLIPDELGKVKTESLVKAEGLIKRIKEVSRGEAISELSPDSKFLRGLGDERIDDIYYATFGGINPTLTRLYLMQYDKTSYIRKEKGFEWKIIAKEIFSIPDILTKFTPKGFIPEELRPGEGDGLVSIKSAHLEWANERHNLPLNHAMILIDPEVKKRVAEILKRV